MCNALGIKNLIYIIYCEVHMFIKIKFKRRTVELEQGCASQQSLALLTGRFWPFSLLFQHSIYFTMYKYIKESLNSQVDGLNGTVSLQLSILFSCYLFLHPLAPPLTAVCGGHLWGPHSHPRGVC